VRFGGAEGLPAGAYFYRLEAGSETYTGAMTRVE
jgi:hypothetical protein